MRRALISVLVVAAALAASVPAFAQDTLGDVLGTTILQNTLTQIGLPQIQTPASTPTQPAQTDGQNTPAHAPAYYCKGQLKKHVKGQSGTPFGQCVKAMAKLQNGTVATPGHACKALTHKHVKGMKKTPFAVCISGATKLLMDQP